MHIQEKFAEPTFENVDERIDRLRGLTGRSDEMFLFPFKKRSFISVYLKFFPLNLEL